MFPLPGNVQLAPARLGMKGTRKAQARSSENRHPQSPERSESTGVLVCRYSICGERIRKISRYTNENAFAYFFDEFVFVYT